MDFIVGNKEEMTLWHCNYYDVCKIDDGEANEL